MGGDERGVGRASGYGGRVGGKKGVKKGLIQALKRHFLGKVPTERQFRAKMTEIGGFSGGKVCKL